MLPLQAIIDNVPDAVFFADKRGAVIHVNQATVDMYGFDNAAEALRPVDEYPRLLELMHTDGRPIEESERPLVRALAGEQFHSCRFMVRTNRGRELLVESSGGPVRDQSGSIISAIVVDRDVTGQRLAELRSETLANVAQAIARERRLDAVLDVAVNAAERIFGADRGVIIWRLDPTRRVLDLLTSQKSLCPETINALQHIPLDAQFVTAKAARTGTVQVVDDITRLYDESRQGRDSALREGVRTLVSIPLCVGDRVVGVLSSTSRSPHPILATDLQFLGRLGNLFAVSIENAWLNDQVEASRREAAADLRAIDAIVQAGSATSDLTLLLQSMVKKMVEVVGAQVGAILLLDQETRLLTMKAAVGVDESVWDGFSLAVGEGFAGRIAAEGRPFAVGDAATNPLVRNERLKERGIRSMLGVPLVSGGRVIGVAHVSTTYLRDFSAGDTRRMEAMAAVASLAIEKTSLFQQAQQGMARLAGMLESVADAVFIADGHGNVVDLNPAALRILGLGDKTEALRPATEYTEFLAAFDLAGQPLKKGDNSLIRAVHGERVMDEVRFRMRDGREIIIQFSSAPVFQDDGTLVASVIVARDVTVARRHARQAEVVAEIARAISQGLDLDQMIETVIEQTMTGLGADFVDVFLADQDRSELRLAGHRGLRPETVALLRRVPFGSPSLAAQAIATGQPQIVEDVGQPDPTLRLLHMAADIEGVKSLVSLPLRASAGCIGALTYGTRSLRRFPEEEIAIVTVVADLFGTAIENCRLYQTSQVRATELEEERARREQFIAVVSHELRGPMTILMGYTQVLARWGAMQPDVQQRTLTVIAEQVRKLNRLVGDLLDASRITSGRFEVQRGRCDLVAVARLVVEQQQATTNRHRIVLELADGDKPVVGSWDEDRVVQALNNLVGNAIKYSPAGGEVRVTVRATEVEAAVSVRDQGVGIPSEQLQLLFQPYSRLHRERHAKGVGLGLYITRGIAEAHGGHILVESKPGQGSTFHLFLPLR